jgi:tetratricopeptide (TPR) repeat protein
MTDASDGKRDFFISYNRADQTWAEWVGWQLEAAGYKVFIQAWDFRPGHNFVLEMHQAAMCAERTLLVLSPNFLASPFTQPEWAAAFAEDPTGKKRQVLPVRIAECDPKGLLGPIVYIDLVGREESEAKDVLLRGVELKRAKPLVSPAFPGAGASVGRPTAAIAKPARFPGALPPIWNLPHLRNPHFTGRDELLETLHRTLIKGPTALTALSGMGGIGKTQVALEYAYRHHTEFDLVWWLRAEEPTTLLTDYAALAGELKLPEAEERELAAVAQVVRRTLEERARWLLVFDNAHDGNDLRDLLPRGGGGRVLITSRNPSWDRVTALEVPLLVRASSVTFLQKRTKQADESTAAALAAELGDLPLALEQAAAFIVRRPMPLADYLTAFRAQREELWKREKPPQDYPDTVRTTWTLAAARLKQEEPGAIALLNLGAFLAPEAIPRWLLAEHCDALPPPLSEAAANSLRWDDFIEVLRSYSLVAVDGGTLTFHRLVQAATRDSLPADDRRHWAEVAVRLVNAALPRPPEEHTNWPAVGTLLPHALAAASAAERLEADLETAAIVLNQIAVYHKARAAWAEAEPLYQRAIAIGEKTLGREHPNLAAFLNNLAELYRATGRYPEAEPLYQRAIAIGEKTLGPEHPNLAAGLNNLAELYRVTGRYAEAEPLYQRAIAIGEKTLGPEHPDLATWLNNLATLYQDTGRYAYAGAELLFKRVLAIRKKTRGPEHPDVATGLNNLAGLYQASGRFDAAEPLLKRALAIDEKALGPEHPDLAIDLNNLAGLYQATGRFDAAEPLFQRAIAILEKALPPEHPNLKQGRENYAHLLDQLGRPAEAAALRGQAEAAR